MSAGVVERLADAKARFYEGSIWEQIPVAGLLSNGAQLALIAIESKLFDEDMERIRQGKRPKHTEALALIRAQSKELDERNRACR